MSTMKRERENGRTKDENDDGNEVKVIQNTKPASTTKTTAATAITMTTMAAAATTTIAAAATTTASAAAAATTTTWGYAKHMNCLMFYKI